MASLEFGSHIFNPQEAGEKFSYRQHEAKIERVAFVLHERRVLTAFSDPYNREVLERVPAAEIASRDYLLAKILVDSQDRTSLKRLGHDVAKLKAQSLRFVK